nr:MAG TPA: nucelotide kinase [Herelleviridae sp.]
MKDNVNSPSHYTQGDIEVIEVIEYITAKYPEDIRYHIGNLIKYICRAPFKGKQQEDLDKSYWYLTRARKVLAQTENSYSGKCKSFIASLLARRPVNGYYLIELPEEPIIDKFLRQTAQNYNKYQQNSIGYALLKLNSNSGNVQDVLKDVDYFLKFVTT